MYVFHSHICAYYAQCEINTAQKLLICHMKLNLELMTDKLMDDF